MKHLTRPNSAITIETTIENIFRRISNNFDVYLSANVSVKIWTPVGDQIGRDVRHDNIMLNLMNVIDDTQTLPSR